MKGEGMDTRFTRLLGIEHPIMCGGMLVFGEPALCAAISNSGGLGTIAAANWEDPEDLRAAIRSTRQLTQQPFGVNITMLPSRFSESQYAGYFRVCCEEGVAAIESTGAPPDRYIGQVHEAGVTIIQKVGSVRHAKHAEKIGVDAIIAAGFEEGGHPLSDDVTTMVLTPRIVEEVNIPVLTAGGIADGRGLAAALALGASGVMMATRFLLSRESVLSPKIKARFLDKGENDTSIICKSTGLQARALDTKLTEQIKEIERQGGGIVGLRDLITGRRLVPANQTGDIEGAMWSVGQAIGLIDELESCAKIVSDMVETAEAVLRGSLSCF